VTITVQMDLFESLVQLSQSLHRPETTERRSAKKTSLFTRQRNAIIVKSCMLHPGLRSLSWLPPALVVFVLPQPILRPLPLAFDVRRHV